MAQGAQPDLAFILVKQGLLSVFESGDTSLIRSRLSRPGSWGEMEGKKTSSGGMEDRKREGGGSW